MIVSSNRRRAGRRQETEPSKVRVALWCACIVAFWTAPSIAFSTQSHGREDMLIVGETGLVTLPSQTRIGKRLTLERGRYLLEHRMKDSTHYVEFTLVSTPYRRRPGKLGGEVPCVVEPLDSKASRTAVFTVSESFVDEQSRVFFDRIIRIEIRGESVAHLFRAEDN